jgi:hypothetical protein
LKYKLLSLLLFLLAVNTSYSQIQYSGSVNLEGYYSSKEKLPFWFYSNQRGRISETTNVAGWLNGKAKYDINAKASLEIGGGLFYQDGFSDKVFIDELYADFDYSWLEVIIGRKQEPELYKGLSTTNENFAWSLNARPMPGIQVQTSRPVYFNKNEKLGIEFSWEEYLMGNDRYVKGTRLHKKNLHLVLNLEKNWKLKGGITHFAQWAGESPRRKQPDGFDDYLKIITGREGGEDAGLGDQVNVLGNHLGTYEFYATKSYDDFRVKFIYNHFFEMGSGSRFASFPDGRYGVFYESDNKDALVNSFIYEFYYTKNQSQTVPHLYDYYFNNYDYASGWTYQNRVIGLPLLTTNYYEDYRGVSESIKVGNNTIIAHHFGVAGTLFQTLPYKLLATYRKNYGHYRNVGYDGFEYYPADDPRGLIKLDKNILSTKLDLQIPNPYLSLNIVFGGDFSRSGTNVGAGLSLSKQF